MRALPTPTTTPLPSLPEGWHALSYKVLTGGRLAVVGTDVDLEAAWQSDRAQQTEGEAWRLATNATGVVWTVHVDGLIEGIRFPLLQPFPLVEQFPDGRWLVVNSRSNGQGNARIYASGGIEQRRIELGDGIAHIKIDAQQRIWVGWFDEGVFGNSHWPVPDNEWPPSSYGMAAFDDKGVLLSHATLESVADCYALNVFGDEAWACIYPDFPIWRMKESQERDWPTSLSGVSAIAVDYPNVLAAGGYQDEADRVVLLTLADQQVRVLGEWKLPFGVGYPSDVSMIDGRECDLHVIQGQQWHRWRVVDFAEAAE